MEAPMKKQPVIWSEAEYWKAKALLKRQRSEQLPRQEDLPALEEAARKEIERVKARLGAG